MFLQLIVIIAFISYAIYLRIRRMFMEKARHIRFYKRCLSPEEVKYIYENGRLENDDGITIRG